MAQSVLEGNSMNALDNTRPLEYIEFRVGTVRYHIRIVCESGELVNQGLHGTPKTRLLVFLVLALLRRCEFFVQFSDKFLLQVNEIQDDYNGQFT